MVKAALIPLAAHSNSLLSLALTITTDGTLAAKTRRSGSAEGTPRKASGISQASGNCNGAEFVKVLLAFGLREGSQEFLKSLKVWREGVCDINVANALVSFLGPVTERI